MRDVIIEAGIPVAVRDFGGDGPPLLLLHGSGGNVAGLAPLAAVLGPAYRVGAPDLRGHGRSGDGRWTRDAVLDDLDDVVRRLDLGGPAVVGVSLGGMVAAHWARRHPECPAVVNLDGNPTPTRPDQLARMDPVRAEAELARLASMFTVMADALAVPLTAEQVDAALAGQRELARRYDLPEAVAVEMVERNLLVDGDRVRLRPVPEVLADLRRAQDALDLDPLYRGLAVPLLHVLATEDLPEQRPFADLYAAYRRNLAELLGDLAESNPCLRVVPLAGASHAMAVQQPARLGALITRFLSGEPPDPDVAGSFRTGA